MFDFIKNNVIAVIAIVVAGIALIYGGEGETRVINVGTSRDTTQFTNPIVADQFTEGGEFTTITPITGAYTLTQAQMNKAIGFTFTASTTMPAFTLTLPATSTMTTLLANSGDTRTWIVENPFTAAATTTTIAAGTGVDLQEPDGQNVVIGINNYAYITCSRLPSTDVVCRVDETIPAD